MSHSASDDERLNAFGGVLLGTAVGDSLGLPSEGMSQRIRARWGGVWRHRFLFGRGMVSDDTEHTLFVAQALLTHPDDPNAFQRCLAWKLRFWLLGLPAGIGLATLKAILKLWVGISPTRSGVWSAGNGPAMRSAIIGVYFADDPVKRRAFVSASTRLTHTDPKAETAALTVAEAAAWAVNQNEPIEQWLTRLSILGCDEEWLNICQKLADAMTSEKSVVEFADSLGLQKGVTGYAYHSVPVALYAWLRHRDDFRKALESALDCGGDTDSVGAMVGAIMGAQGGKQSIPPELITGIAEWPRSVLLLEQVAAKLSQQKDIARALGPVRYFWPGLTLRNPVFLAVVLIHGLRRLAPPY
ncbi:MAG: ADP-ribosylglycohydrolase family protein [Verrucomicrobiota bacterium]